MTDLCYISTQKIEFLCFLTETRQKHNAIWHSSFKPSKCRQTDAPIEVR